MGTAVKSSVLDSLKAASKAIDDATKAAADLLKPALQQFLAEHPRIRALRWTQYAPHFNDGEPCTFSVHDLHVFYGAVEKDDDLPDGVYDNGWLDCGEYGDEDQIEETAAGDLADLEALNGVLQSNESALKQLFGPDCMVTVTKSGIEIGEYDHD